MSISHSLSNALSGLTAASRMAEVVSSNLSNALTDGYGRRRLDLSSMSVGGRGAGVQIDGVQRMVDRSILSDRRLADSGMSGQKTLVKAWARLETVIGAVGDDTGLSGQLAAVERAMIAAASDPQSDQHLSGLVSQLGSLTAGLRNSAEGIRTLRQESDQSIATQVDDLNQSLRQVATLNADITRSRNTGGDPSALMDQRQRVIDQIATIVPLREMDRAGGQVALMTTSGLTLLDGPPAQFGFTAATYVTPDMTLASGALAGITLDGTPLDVSNGYGKLAGGSLAAQFKLRDQTLTDAQAGLDAIARDLVERFQDPATDPTLVAGDAGLLTDAGTAFDPLDTVGLSGRIAVNAAIDPSRGGALFRLRDGINAVAPGPVGNATQLHNWHDALTDRRSLTPGGLQTGAAGHVAALTSAIGAGRVDADAEMSFASARYGVLREAELADGVDSDHEMQMLLRIEQAYAANAKVVQTVQSMIQTLMEI